MGRTQGRGTLYIAGSSSAVPRPGRANSGYLLTAGGTSIAIDLGSGALARLREKMEPSKLHAVVISHMHADHFFDLVPLRYALKYEMHRGEPLPVYLPPGGTDVVRTIGKPLRETGDFYDGVLDLREYAPDSPLQVGAFSIRFARTMHYIPAFAMRVDSGVGILGYSADTAPCDAVPALVRGADLFLCEAALGAHGRESGTRGHVNAAEAGELARRAGIEHLVLTHYSAKADPQALREAAARTFEGKISVADDGMEFTF